MATVSGFPLPKDLLTSFCKKYLPIGDLGRMRRVCKAFNSIVLSKALENNWKEALETGLYFKYQRIPGPKIWSLIFIGEAARDSEIKKAEAAYKKTDKDFCKLVAWANLMIEREEHYERLGEKFQSQIKQWNQDRLAVIEAIKLHPALHSPDLYALLGKIYFYTQVPDYGDNEALRYLTYAKEKGCVDVIHYIGRCYILGKMGTHPDQHKALNFNAEGANLGITECKGALGWFNLMGIGCEIRPDSAFENIKQGADNGMPGAEKVVAQLFLHGIGTKIDTEQAFLYCKKAADKGIVEALCLLAGLYLRGIGTKNDEQQALYYIKSATGKTCQDECSYYTEKKKDISPILSEIIDYCRQAAEIDSAAEANFLLAYLYFNGIGVEKDDYKVIRYLSEAECYGSILAKHELMMCYEKGFGTEKNSIREHEYSDKLRPYNLPSTLPYSVFNEK